MLKNSILNALGVSAAFLAAGLFGATNSVASEQRGEVHVYAKTAGNVAVKSEANVVGRLVQMSDRHGAPVIVKSDNGYLFAVDPESGVVGGFQVLFDGPNCTGQAYVERLTGIYSGNGQVLGIDHELGLPKLYYTTVKGAAPASVFAYSKLNALGCFAEHRRAANVTPVAPNDPAVTGVPNARIALPITIE